MSASPPLSSPAPPPAPEQATEVQAADADTASTSKSPSPDSSSSAANGATASSASSKPPRGRTRAGRSNTKASRSSRISAKRHTSEGLQTPATDVLQMAEQAGDVKVETGAAEDTADDARVDDTADVKAEALETATNSEKMDEAQGDAGDVLGAKTASGPPQTEQSGADIGEDAKERARRSSTRQSGSGSPRPGSVSDKQRQRSTSTFKELASLGLHTFGDGDDSHLPPRRSRRAANSPDRQTEDVKEGSELGEQSEAGLPANVPQENDDEVLAEDRQEARTAGWEGEEPEGEAGEGETRCVCGSPDENVGLMIQCDSCKCWQHCICMGLHTEDDCPDVYFCEQCRPELHIALLRSLGVLPVNKSHKKGASKSFSKLNAKDAKRELKEAKQAVLLLAADNERRRKAGQEVLTGWSVAHNPALAALAPNSGRISPPSPSNAPATAGAAHHRQPSDSQGAAHGRSESRDDDVTQRQGRASPKRRSTMNSRDSAYGWESIPPGLLNEDEQWDAHGNERIDDDDRKGSKRKRGHNEASPSRSPSPADGPYTDQKRRKVGTGTSPGAEERPGARGISPAGTVAGKKASAKKSGTEESSSGATKPKHPNQYTYRAKDRATAAASAAAAYAAGGAGAGPSSSGTPQQSGAESPSPSPHKQRNVDQGVGGGRRGALRDQAGLSRNGTPAPHSDSSRPGGNLGMPEHLSHLAHLLNGHSLEPLSLHPPLATKGAPRVGASRHAGNKDAEGASAPIIEPMQYTTQTLHEPRTKVRFPPKRMTLGEMRKRVRNIGEYVTRSQVEAVERSRRTKLLGIKISIPGDAALAAEMDKAKEGGEVSVEAASHGAAVVTDASTPAAEHSRADANNAESQREHQGHPEAVPGAEETNQSVAHVESSTGTNSQEGSTPASGSDTPLSMRLVEELSRDLARFNQRFGGLPAYGLSAS